MPNIHQKDQMPKSIFFVAIIEYFTLEKYKNPSVVSQKNRYCCYTLIINKLHLNNQRHYLKMASQYLRISG